MKTRLLYLKYILNQKEESRLYQFFMAQLNKPERRDWVSTCQKNIEDLDLNITLEEMKNMKETKFRKVLKEKIKIKAMEYLTEKIKSKGKEIRNERLHMADYLLPFSRKLTIIEKQEVFVMRTKMTKIPSNFKTTKELIKCICDQPENMSHIYSCKILNSEKIVTKYENIYGEDIENITKVYERFRKNMEIRDNLQKEKFHETYNIGPLFSVPCIVNGNG